MKLYKDITNDLIISVTDENLGFPLDTATVERGVKINPNLHKLAIEASIVKFAAEHGLSSILNNDEPLKTPAYDFPYNGMFLDEVIEKFCGEPEEI